MRPSSAAARAVLMQVLDKYAEERPSLHEDSDAVFDRALTEIACALVERAAWDVNRDARRQLAWPALESAVGPLGSPSDIGPQLRDLLSQAADDGRRAKRLSNAAAVLRHTDLLPLPHTPPLPARVEPPDSDLEAAFERYLRERGDERRVTAATTIAGGFSKETVLLRLERQTGADEVVVRRVVAGRNTGSLAEEYGVLAHAHRSGIPVPSPLWLDAKGGALGLPLFVTRRAAGRTVGDVTGPTDPAAAKVVDQLARILAGVHQVPILETMSTPRPSMASQEDLLGAISQREEIVRAAADVVPWAPGLDLQMALFDWLRNHLPPMAGGEVLVHGDVGFHNILVDGEEITALLDWELSHRGRAAEDLAYVKPTLEQLGAWDEFLTEYQRHREASVDPDELRFFTVWQDVWRAASCTRLLAKFTKQPDLWSDAISGLVLRVRFLDSAVVNAFERE